jgi:hypothetical protein
MSLRARATNMMRRIRGGRSVFVPFGQSAIGLMFSPEPCDFDHEASRETVASLRDTLATGR